jgi:curved DNA-binding protein CbpA
MSSLYNILGLGRNATAEQVEQAYQLHFKKLKEGETVGSAEADIARMRAIKEAYAVLSDASRRANYDAKLKLGEQVRYEVVEAAPFPWVRMLLVFVLVVGGGIYIYKHQENKARLEQLKLEAAKADAEAERVKNLEAIEQARLDRELLNEKRRVEDNRNRETEIARYEGRQIHSQMEQHDARTAREKEQKERQAKYESAREEQLARQRAQNENAAMQRALNIPIRGR